MLFYDELLTGILAHKMQQLRGVFTPAVCLIWSRSADELDLFSPPCLVWCHTGKNVKGAKINKQKATNPVVSVSGEWRVDMSHF